MVYMSEPQVQRTRVDAPAMPQVYDHFVRSQEHLLRQTESNPLPTTIPPPSAGLAGASGKRHVISFIGLPYRGKPFLAERLCRYLSFFHGTKCRMFDIARPEWKDDAVLWDALKVFLEEEDCSATTQVMMALDEIECDQHQVFRKNVDSGRIAILYSHDEVSTHSQMWSGSSKEHRWAMQTHLEKLSMHSRLLVIEVIVNDAGLVRRFIRNRDCTNCGAASTEGEGEREGGSQESVCSTNGDAEALITAAEAKVKEYTRVYVTIQDDGSEDELAYVKLYNYGHRVVTNRIRGFLFMRIVQYISHIHPEPHQLYLSRHGQSTYNAVRKIGGNPGLTEDGERYALWLGAWVPDHICTEGPGQPHRACRLWTSSMKRTIDTARHIPHPLLELGDGQLWQQMSLRVYRNLDEIFAGEYEGMTYEEIERTSGDEAILRKKDKLGYRYPRGESYFDLIARLEPLMHELESYKEPLLIVSHQATLRMVYAYLMGIDRTEAPKLDIPLHTVIKIQYDGFGRQGQTVTEERNPGPLVSAADGQRKL
uniref:6-phosphofructo-2-kinase domain-containing protein n=1 Tax=Alexandrium catenella TaxID=2925 RepID=A0A7S1LSW2_ALECA